MGPAPVGRSCEEGKVPSHWEPSSPAGRSAATDRELQRLGGECTSWLAAGRTERHQHRQSWLPCCTYQQRHTPADVAWQPDAEAQASADRPRERTQFGCMETTQRTWSVVRAATGGGRRMEPRSTKGAPLSMHT